MNKWIEVVEDGVIQPGGEEGIYGYLKKPPGVFIIAIDGDKNIYFVEEFRYVLGKAIIQLPAGVLDKGLSSLENAKKELKEETGILADKWEKLGEYFVAPGHETTKEVAYLAEDLDISNLKISNQEGDESILAIRKFHIDEVKNMIKNGEIECGLTLAALNLFFFNL